MKKPKYRNIKTLVDGIVFDSKLEAKRWLELKLLQRAGTITELERQYRMPLQVKGKLICTFVADFTYLENNRRVIEDTKSPITAKERSYRIKKKLLKAITGHDVVEVFK